jgi:uncharacterized BrkB/YihY/UPF0761 family membrane protein
MHPPQRPDSSDDRPGRLGAAQAYGEGLLTQLQGKRTGNPLVEIGFRWFERDKQIAGGVLGGGLAYRFFFWTLAFSLLFFGALGFTPGRLDTRAAAEEAGLTNEVAKTVATAAQQSQEGRWWLLALGVYLTLWFSFSLVRALRLVHAAAWQVKPGPLRLPHAAVGAVLAAPVVLAALGAGAGWLRVHLGTGLGLLATLAWAAAVAALWVAVSDRLPRGDVASWKELLPGAVFVAVAAETLHLFTVYFLADRLASSSELYGALGLAGTTLFYLYLLGRIVVWSAELNAVVVDVRRPRADGESPT